MNRTLETENVRAAPPPPKVCSSGARRSESNQATASLLPHCLIVSGHESTGDWVRRGAVSAGWAAVLHSEPLAALRESMRRRFHLAIVDCRSAVAGDIPISGRNRQLIEDLRISQVSLVVAFGDEGDADAEIVMRQLGVWTYLPGVDTSESLVGLFDAARDAVERTDPSLRQHPLSEAQHRAVRARPRQSRT